MTQALALMNLLSLDDIAKQTRSHFERHARRLASPLYLGDGTALCRIFGRQKFYVATQDYGFGSNVLLDGYWESWLTQFMARRIRSGMTVVDVGANFGYYTLLMADLVGSGGTVYAIEPNPAITPLLGRSIALNGFAERTRLCELAAGKTGSPNAILVVPDHEPKNGALIAGWAGDGTQHEVAVTALDELIEPGTAIDFMKIDAEGGEEAILAGMERIFRSSRPAMVLEFNAARYADPAGFLQQLIQLYGKLEHVDYAGHSQPITESRVLGQRIGEDWLLFLELR